VNRRDIGFGRIECNCCTGVLAIDFHVFDAVDLLDSLGQRFDAAVAGHSFDSEHARFPKLSHGGTGFVDVILLHRKLLGETIAPVRQSARFGRDGS
jgi:hypothetical protein